MFLRCQIVICHPFATVIFMRWQIIDWLRVYVSECENQKQSTALY